MDGDQAKQILTTVRRFYEFGEKSANKAYTDNHALLPPKSPDADSKQGRRNNNYISRSQTLNALRDTFKGKTLYEIGEKLWTERHMVGNCGEMATVAVYIAVAMYKLRQDQAFVRTVIAPGGWFIGERSFNPHEWHTQGGFTHQFAFFGDETDEKNGWFVDPWCNIYCRPEKYNALVMTKLAKWESEGKRLMVPKYGWAKPTAAEITGILCAKSESLRADKTIPGH